MTSIRKPHQPPYPQKTVPAPGIHSGAKQIALIVGLACLAGFIVDILLLGMPFSPFNLQWRVGFLLQLGDRSIVLLIGTGLFIYSQIGNRTFIKPLSLLCLATGVAFLLSCIIIISDGLTLQDQAVSRISTQVEELQTQIEASRGSAELPADIEPEEFEIASQRVTSQAEALKQNTRQGITKAGLSSAGNLVAVGLGLVGLGRFGLVSARRGAGLRHQK